MDSRPYKFRPIRLLLRRAARASRLIGMATLLALGLSTLPAQAQTHAPSKDWWVAIAGDDASAVRSMLLNHTDPNAYNERGNPALIQAVREQSWKAFDALREDPSVQIDEPNALDETALMYLCILGETRRAEALIQAGAQVNRLGWTPLHYAASKAQMDTAKMLIAKGAIINAPGPDGTTPLMMAALSGSADMVQLLLDHGADPTMFNTNHETAADWALKGHSDDLAAKLRTAAAHDRTGRGSHTQTSAGTNAGNAGQAGRSSAAGKDESSFSRYFDLDRFEDAAPGK